MGSKKNLRVVALVVAIGAPFLYAHPVFAATGDISNVENFIRSIIQLLAGIAGLVATGFFVAGGYHYITSSGNPENLQKAKHTLIYSSLGLAITIGAFVLSNIITTLATNAFGK